MKLKTSAIVLAGSLFASLSWAGIPTPALPPVSGAPAMDEGGLVLLAVALVGAGLTFLRGNKR